MLWCHWVVSKSCLEVSIWKFLQSLSWCFEPGCEKRELSDTECSCGNDMPIEKQVYLGVHPFWLKYVTNIRLSMEKSTLNCVILTGLGYIWWFGLRPWGSGRLSLNESHGPPLLWTPPAGGSNCNVNQAAFKSRGLSSQLPSYWKLLWIHGTSAVWWQKS